MEPDQIHKKTSVGGQFRTSVDIAMGVIYVLIPLYAMQMSFILETYGSTTVGILAGLFICYGLFRIYRGFKRIKKPPTME